jgi:hypothetical protein
MRERFEGGSSSVELFNFSNFYFIKLFEIDFLAKEANDKCFEVGVEEYGIIFVANSNFGDSLDHFFGIFGFWNI